MNISNLSWIKRWLVYVKSVVIIRRMEFCIVEITIFGMPVLVAMNSPDDIFNYVLLEGLILFFILFSLGDIINSLADRELDKAYKTRISDAIFELGVDNIRWCVGLLTIVSIIIAVHLAWTTQTWTILFLVGLGIFLGIQYSVGPIYLKSRGILHLICLWLLLYAIPMLYAGVLVKGFLTTEIVLLAASYATLEMGIILINTSEDLPEDLARGIKTTTVALGLKPTLTMALMMLVGGSAAFLIFWGKLMLVEATSIWSYVPFACLSATCLYVFLAMKGLVDSVRAAASEELAVSLVKTHGRLVPLWATAVGWMGLMCGICYQLLR